MPTTSLRSGLTAAGALVLLTGLAACGGSSTDASGSGASAAPTSAAPTSAAPSAAPTSAAPAAAPTSAAPPAGMASGALTAVDQSGNGTTLKVTAVDLKGADGGWIAVHKDLGGKPGPVVGEAHVGKGATAVVTVKLDKKSPTGAYWPMLHVDDHAKGKYEFPKTVGADLPVMSSAGIVMKKIMLTVH